MSRQLAWLWGVVAMLLVAASPWAELVAGSLWPCTFKSVTGFACPSCGTVRAALALARLDFTTALTSFPLQSVGWILLIGGGFASLLAVVCGTTLPGFPKVLSIPARVGIAAAVAANWAYCVATGV